MAGDRRRPLKAGLSIGRSYGNRGTICCFLEGKTDSKYYLLSCSHVINGQTQLETPIIQPADGYSDDDAVAEFRTDVELKEEGNLVDAAIAEILVKEGLISELKFENKLLNGEPIRGIAPAIVGTDVKIIGAISKEVTGLKIISTDKRATVRLRPGSREIKFESQLLISRINNEPLGLKEGDSGAPVLTKDNELVGIFFALWKDREALASKIEIVLKELNVQFFHS